MAIDPVLPHDLDDVYGPGAENALCSDGLDSPKENVRLILELMNIVGAGDGDELLDKVRRLQHDAEHRVGAERGQIPLPETLTSERLDFHKEGGVLEVPTGRETIKVRILRAARATYWYAGLEGREFDTYRRGDDFVLKEDYDAGPSQIWRHVGAEDCEIVTAA